MIKKTKITSHNADFLKEVIKISDVQVTVCDQCGVCSASCPFTEEMDITPSNIMRMVQFGMEAVMDTNSMWICASCFMCMTRCPRGMDLSKVAEALRQIKLRKAIDQMDIGKIDKEEAEKLPAIAVVGSFRKLTG